MTEQDLAARLNSEQLAAVLTDARRALVLAGAGSGKTRTLVHRVAWLLARGLAPERILLLTFTNKAAREMMGRVEELSGGDLRRLWGGTFHSICNRILRRHAGEIGFGPAFSILDREDQTALLKELAAPHLKADKQFPRPAVLIEVFGYAASTSGELSRVIVERFPQVEEYGEEIGSIARAYVERKRDTDAMDFDDLLVQCVRLLETSERVAGLYRTRFRHILVDEFQDTNSVQAHLVRLLCGPETSVMVVGDDAQAIYSWRGADPGNILNYPEQEGASVHRVELNYRSVPEVLAVANAVINQEPEGFGFHKELHAQRARRGILPAVVEVYDGAQQARFVVGAIRELIEEGISPSEIAVLYRAHYHSMELQVELTRRQVPYRVTSGVRFFEQAHVKDAVAFLRFASNPKDGVAFKRVAQMIPGIGEGTARKVWGGVEGAGVLVGSMKDLLWDLKVPSKSRKGWEQLAYTLEEIAAPGVVLPPTDALHRVSEAMLDDYLKAEYPDYPERAADLEMLGEFARQFESTPDFLAELALLGGVDAEEAPEEAARDRVTLSSIHQAKGLEWAAVFLIGLNEGMFPTGRSLDSEAALAEERRLFYVAVTRAKDRLFLLRPMIRTDVAPDAMLQVASRFLREIPGELVEKLSVSEFA